MDNYKSRHGSLNDIKNSGCARDKREEQSERPIKFYLQDFHKDPTCQTRGINFNDGFGVSRANIDKDTQFRHGRATHPKIIQELGPLPLPTTAGRYLGQGDIYKEDKLIRGLDDSEFHACGPKDSFFYERHFSIFDSLSVVPNACVKNIVQQSNGFRQGVDTRNANLSKYTS